MLKVTFKPNEVETFLRVDSGVDPILDTLQDMALNEAETYLNTDFSTVVINEDGTTTTTPNEAPASVKVWILNRMAQMYENRGFNKETGRETRFVAAQMPDYTLLESFRIIPFK